MAGPDPADLDAVENWAGGGYELSILLGVSDDDRLDRALEALWSAGGIEGPFKQVGWWGAPPIQHRPARLTLAEPDTGHLHGRVAVPPFGRIVCGAWVTRYDESGTEMEGRDQLTFYLPTAALAAADPRVGGWPFGDLEDAGAWHRPLDAWLAELAMQVYAAVPFEVGAIGYEPDSLDREFLEAHHHIALLVPTDEGLEFRPAPPWAGQEFSFGPLPGA